MKLRLDRSATKVLGIAGLLVVVAVVTTFLSYQPGGGYTFLSDINLENLLQRLGMYGVLSLGAAFVIVTGGIDLSVGAVVCVTGCLLPWAVSDLGLSAPLSLGLVLAVAAAIGLFHGLLIVGLGLQPFVVTLCGLLLYRGIMREFAQDQTIRFASTDHAVAWLGARLDLGLPIQLPVAALLLVVVAVLASVFFRRTVQGRHLLAMGRSKEAARLSGVAVQRLEVMAYVVCSLLAGLGGCLFVVNVGSAQASSFGQFYELYAIAGAVLGGVALRGGEAAVLGVVLGTALMQVLSNAVTLTGKGNRLEFAVVGAVILIGAAADEGFRRLWRRRPG